MIETTRGDPEHTVPTTLSKPLIVLERLYKLARPYGRKKAAIVFAIILFQGAMQVIGVASVFPFLAVAANPPAFRESQIGSSILQPFPGITDSELLYIAGFLSIALLFVSNASSLLGDYVRARYSHGLGHWLRVRLLQEMASKPWSYFLQQNTGILLKKASGDVLAMVHNVLIPLLEATSRMISSVLLVLTLFLFSPAIAAGATIALTSYYLVVFRFFRSRRMAASEGFKIAGRGAMREAQQLLGAIKPAKIHRCEQHFIDRFRVHSHALARLNAKLPIFFLAPKYILEPIAFGGVIAIVLVYASIGKDFAEILPTLGVIGLVGYRLLPAAQLVYGQFSQISTSLHSLDEVSEEFRHLAGSDSISRDRPPLDRGTPMQFNRSIRLEEVTFTYPGVTRAAVDGLTLEIPRNSSLGIVGPTGSGKSTLVDLILGLHIPTSGRILIDEEPLVETNSRNWQASIGYVPQDIFLIDDSVTRNIAFGLPDKEIDFERVREVAGMAQILEFIERELPNGFDTTVGERGVRLSGGQRQRIALARALYHRPQLLIFDEATSALDTKTEAEVMNAIKHLHGTVTLILITHRLSTVEGCDLLLDLSNRSVQLRVTG
jgi:ATP-binding cassette subfamily C protein